MAYEQEGRTEQAASRKQWVTPQIIVAKGHDVVAKSFTTQPGDFTYAVTQFGS